MIYGDLTEDQDFFLIQDTSFPGYVVHWWAESGNGYTFDLNKAGVYTRREAEAQAQSRSTDRAVPVVAIKKCTTCTVVCSDSAFYLNTK